MRTYSVKWIAAAVFFAFVFPVLTNAQTHVRTANITGNYVLYREGDLNGKVVGYMRISGQRGNQFSIGIASPTGNPALDWQGNGVINGAAGYYDWVFKDGKRGRTTFSIDNSRYIHGKVRGSGLTGDYVARRQ